MKGLDTIFPLYSGSKRGCRALCKRMGDWPYFYDKEQNRFNLVDSVLDNSTIKKSMYTVKSGTCVLSPDMFIGIRKKQEACDYTSLHDCTLKIWKSTF